MFSAGPELNPEEKYCNGKMLLSVTVGQTGTSMGFFLSERGIYLLLLSSRDECLLSPINYCNSLLLILEYVPGRCCCSLNSLFQFFFLFAHCMTTISICNKDLCIFISADLSSVKVNSRF